MSPSPRVARNRELLMDGRNGQEARAGLAGADHHRLAQRRDGPQPATREARMRHAIPETLYEYLSRHGVSYDVIPHQKTNCSRMNARNECSRSIRCKSRERQAQERLRAGGRFSLARGRVETFGSVIRASGLPRHRTGTPWSVHGLRSRRHSASGPSLRHSDGRRQAAARPGRYLFRRR